MSGALRVVGGVARGRRLYAPPGVASRPTRALVKEAVFDMLASLGGVQDARVADLFAGSGALGIEALSRGADGVTFVDADRRAVDTIRANLAALGTLGKRGQVIRSDVAAWARATGGRGAAVGFDLVLCDPPYAFGGWPELFGALAGLVTPDALVVAESAAAIEAPPGWVSVRNRSYGASVVSMVGVASQPDLRQPEPSPQSDSSQKGPE